MAGPWARVGTAVLLAAAAASSLAPAGNDKDDLRRALKDDGLVGDWIYDDIDAGFVRAAKEKRPLCVVFR